MIGIINKRPEIYTKQGLPEHSETFKYFELYEARVYGYCVLDIRFLPYCLLHLEIIVWNHHILRELERDWKFMKDIIRSLGCNCVVLTKSGNLSNQTSYKKLIKRFGFSEPIELTQSTQEI